MKRTRTPAAPDAERVEELPALFATIHFRSVSRPDGYTDDEIGELNRLANGAGSKRSD